MMSLLRRNGCCRATRPPYSVGRVAAMIAGETGRTVAEVLAEARAIN